MTHIPSSTVVMSADQWSEFCHAIRMLDEQARILAAEHPNAHLWTPAIQAASQDLRAQITEVDDANVRRAYAELAG